jgi:hypothetical protein
MAKRGFALILLALFFLISLFSFLISATAQTAPSCLQAGTLQEGWYQNEQMIMNASCSGCNAVCEHTGTEQEGWYSSCDKSLIKQELCLVKCYSDESCPTKSYNSYCQDSKACTETISQKCENPGTTASKCVASSSVSCIDCTYGCSNGFCKSQEIPQVCIDSDSEDYHTRGYVKTESGEIWDSCSGMQLNEGICKDGKYNPVTYACPQGCSDGRCVKQETWTGSIRVEVVESICEPCPTSTAVEKETTTCKCDSIKLYSAKIHLYDSSGNLIGSGYTSNGYVEFSGLKEGKYIAVASASGYNQHKAEFKIIGGESDYLTIGLEKQTTTEPIPTPVIYWYRNAYWQCYDGYEEKSGGETSCKPAEVWKHYAEESCIKQAHCSNETGKCGVNTFKVYNECPGSNIIQPSVCGNGVCESGEGETCEIAAVACEIGKKCEAPSTKPSKCYYGCEQDCKRIEEKSVHAKLNEKFKLHMSQEAEFEDNSLQIKFNDLFVPRCIEEFEERNTGAISPTKTTSAAAVVEKYDTLTGRIVSVITGKITTATKPLETQETTTTSGAKYVIARCIDAEPHAVLQIKLGEEKNERTEVIKLQVGEKKSVFDFAISFLDFDVYSKTGLFLVSKEAFDCPKNCICDLEGNSIECKKIEECEKGTRLCPDGICRKKCNIENITTECNFGCFYNEKCLPYGLRINKLYCSIDDNMKSQLQAEEECENNFECQSNVCVNSKCVSAGLIQKVLDWFKSLFGG